MTGRILGMGMGIGLIGGAMLLVGCNQNQKLEETQHQLTTATNELATARAEAAEVRTQMQVRVETLQHDISKLSEEKVDTENKMAALKTDLEQKLQQQQLKVEGLEQDKTNMTSELQVLTAQIEEVNQKLANLQKTHAQTVTHLQAMREEYVKLTNDKAALEARLHDLKALKEQITVVKQELHEKKVEELKRLDRAEFAMGNHGYLLHDGSWVVERKPGSYPFNQELYRQP
jgi:chromosome segregation ATPase